jgi:uncharacterized protein
VREYREGRVNEAISQERLQQRFIADCLQNPYNADILKRLAALGLPDAWLVAGCLFQTVWNLQTGAEPTAQINDYDIFYFDGNDLSAEAEKAVQARVAGAFADLPVKLEAVNQARVHIWYPGYFGEPYSALKNSEEAITRYLVACTCVGLQPNPAAQQGLKLSAPNGVADLYAGILRPNWVHRLELFERKCQSYIRRWPHLQVPESLKEAP